MVGMCSPYTAVANDATSPTRVTMPITDPTALGWDMELPFVITAEKQAISDSVAFEKTRSIACPSKSGIESAISGIPETSSALTGMKPLTSIGTLAFVGHRLQ